MTIPSKLASISPTSVCKGNTHDWNASSYTAWYARQIRKEIAMDKEKVSLQRDSREANSRPGRWLPATEEAIEEVTTLLNHVTRQMNARKLSTGPITSSYQWMADPPTHRMYITPVPRVEAWTTDLTGSMQAMKIIWSAITRRINPRLRHPLLSGVA